MVGFEKPFHINGRSAFGIEQVANGEDARAPLFAALYAASDAE
jgi:hypothetical protein